MQQAPYSACLYLWEAAAARHSAAIETASGWGHGVLQWEACNLSIIGVADGIPVSGGVEAHPPLLLAQ
jgi:hypothetical protein